MSRTKEEIKEYTRDWNIKNKEARRVKSAEWQRANKEKCAQYAKKYRAANKEKVKAAQAISNAKWRAENPEKKAEDGLKWQRANKEKVSAANVRWKKANPHKLTAMDARRRAAKFSATTTWGDSKAIEDIYALAKAKALETGEVFHVDHIVPLQSPLVCGLHVEANLTVMRGKENCSKANRFWPDMPGDVQQ